MATSREPSYKLASIPRYDDIVRTAGWAGSARVAGRRPAGDGRRPQNRATHTGSGRGRPAGDRPPTWAVLNITAAVWNAVFHSWRSCNKKRTQNVSEYMLVLALCLVSIVTPVSLARSSCIVELLIIVHSTFLPTTTGLVLRLENADILFRSPGSLKYDLTRQSHYTNTVRVCVITGSIARSAKRRYLIYSEADFEVRRPASIAVKFGMEEQGTFTHLLHAKFHPIGATIRV